MSKEYPKFDSWDLGLDKIDECWKKYSDKIKSVKERTTEFKFPIRQNADILRIKNYNRCRIEQMSPQRFLELSAPKQHIRPCSLDYIVDGFEVGYPTLPPLYLEPHKTPKGKCRIGGHEGRHRAEIARDLGVDKVPVVICYKETSKPYGYTLDMRTLEGYDEVREIDDYIIANGKYVYDKILEVVGDKWETPEGCETNKLLPEANPFRSSVQEVLQERKMYREKYGLSQEGKIL